MQCLILAGGLGTRIKTIAGDKPKALLEIGSQTFIDWQLQWLKILGISDVVMALGHGGEQIVSHIKAMQTASSYPQVNYSFDGPELLGTGGAIKNAQDKLSKDFIVTYGDTILFLNVNEMARAHSKSQKPLTMSLLKNNNIADKSNTVYKNGEIKLYDKFNITGEMDYIDYGMSIVNKKYFLEHTPQGKFDYSQFMTACTKEGKAAAFIVTEWFQEVGSVTGYNGFCETLKNYHYDLKKMAIAKNVHI